MIYDYKCSACQHIFERYLSMADMKVPESEPCPKCGEVKVEKQITTVSMFQRDTLMKPDAEFTSLLRQIKKNNRHSTIDV